MILAREFRVDPRAPLSWSYSDFYGALQLLSEERLGRLVRGQQRAEDQQFKESLQNLR